MLRAPTWITSTASDKASAYAASVSSVTTGRPVSARASSRITKASVPRPWNENGEVRGLNAPPRSIVACGSTACATASVCERDSTVHGPAIRQNGASPPTPRPFTSNDVGESWLSSLEASLYGRLIGITWSTPGMPSSASARTPSGSPMAPIAVVSSPGITFAWTPAASSRFTTSAISASPACGVITTITVVRAYSGGEHAGSRGVAVDLDLDAVAEEADVPRHRGPLAQRLGVRPYRVLERVALGCADRPVGRRPLVGAHGDLVARLQQIAAHVLERDVRARRKAGLEEELRPRGLGHDLAVRADRDGSVRLAHVDPVERVAQVAEDLLGLLVPRVHPIPVRRHVARKPRCALDRLGVAPEHVFGRLAAGVDRPVGRVALEWAMAGVAGRREQLLADVLERHVEHGRERGLVEELPADRVDDGLAADHRPHPARVVHEVEEVLRSFELPVEIACRVMPERAAAEGEAHRAPASRKSLTRRKWRV